MPLSDAEIIAGSLHDPERFAVIYERHYDTIFRYVARRVGLDRAADLTAEVFLRGFRLRTRFDTSRDSCRPWLYGIATNVVGDDLRRMRRQQRNHLALASLTASDDDQYSRADERIVAAAAVADEINRALRSLRSGDRDVLLLYAVENLTYQETADALNVPIGTVRSRLSRARRRTRELLPDLEQTTIQNTVRGNGPP